MWDRDDPSGQHVGTVNLGPLDHGRDVWFVPALIWKENLDADGSWQFSSIL
jgi:hypothetical protein